MLNPQWPATLPGLNELGGLTEEPPDNVLRSPMDAGPPKLRRRSTAGVRSVAGSMVLTAAQLDELDDFYGVTLVGGTIPFDGTHPRTGATMAANLKRPRYKHLSGPLWQATIALEILP